eukprot:6490770-Amphidinium_carterae.2
MEGTSRGSSKGSLKGGSMRGKGRSIVKTVKADEGDKGKKKGMACAACKARPASTEWAEMQGQTAVGDKCMRCCKQWSTYFMHMSWAEFVERMATEDCSLQRKNPPSTFTYIPFRNFWTGFEGQAIAVEIEAHESAPDRRPFLPSQVEKETALQLIVEKKFILMSESDFLRRYGQKHRSKDPRLPKIYLPGVGGEQELHYVFKPDDLSHKVLKVVSAYGNSKKEQVLEADGHMYLSQAQDLLKFQHQQAMESTSASALLIPQAWSCLSTVEEYEEHKGLER